MSPDVFDKPALIRLRLEGDYQDNTNVDYNRNQTLESADKFVRAMEEKLSHQT